jgi:glucans biosynthesis protein
MVTNLTVPRDKRGRLLKGSELHKLTPRCGAQLRRRPGTRCRLPARKNGRCRLHGGADGVGAPPGNINSLKHGRYSREAIAERKASFARIRACVALLRASKMTPR